MKRIHCPYCDKPIPRSVLAAYIGSFKSEKKALASRENGKRGGRPKKYSRVGDALENTRV